MAEPANSNAAINLEEFFSNTDFLLADEKAYLINALVMPAGRDKLKKQLHM